MAQTSPSPEAVSLKNSQVIFSRALDDYKEKTGKDLTSDPLYERIESCDSPDEILAILRIPAQKLLPNRPQSMGDKLLTWLDPTIYVLHAFAETVGKGVSPVCPPVGVICTGIGVLLSTAKAVRASRKVLLGLFGRIEDIFKRLEVYINVPLSQDSGMTYAIVKVMVEVLYILAIATKEISRNCATKYLRKLVGRTDIEDALQKLDQAAQEEARMAAAESLKATYGVGPNVQDMLKATEERIIREVLQGGDNRRQGVDDSVTVTVVNGAEKTGPQRPSVVGAVAASGEGLKTTQGIDDKVQRVHDTQEGVSNRKIDADDVQNVVQALQGIGTKVIDAAKTISGPIAGDLSDPSRDQLRQCSTEWLSPPDPAINYGIARDAHQRGTAKWLTESNTFRNWKESGSLLWIHGKPGSGKTILTSTIIQDIEHISSTGSAHMAYFFFDFKDIGKQDARAFLSSILVQLSGRSVSFCNILLEFYLAHQRGSRQPSDSALLQCLEKMLRAPGNVPIYLIIDAVDECPDASEVQSPREKVLKLLEKLVGFHLSTLRLCVTSRCEVDIRDVLEPLTSTRNRILLHDEDGQKKDIADYASSVVHSDKKMMKWREKDKELVIRALSDRNGGVFRWVSCQIETLRRCLVPSVRRVIEELPDTLDKTYERILQEIPKANRVQTHRLLQCLTVAIRPLCVEELVEVLAVDFGAPGGIPKLNEEWRWKDQEEAVLTACSSLIAVVDVRDSRMVQFSHSSVKEFLTSDRLAMTNVDTLRYHNIQPEPAHTIMARACIGVLLGLEYPIDIECLKRFPLADYAAKHFADHAGFGKVISRLTDEVGNLLDEDKPHFAAWMSHLRPSWLSEKPSGLKASPLYNLADLGYNGLVRHILEAPHTTISTGVLGLSVHAALHQGHVQVFQLLLQHCSSTDVRDSDGQTLLHLAVRNANIEAARTIIGQDADMNPQDNNGWTPLHEATVREDVDVTRLLLERGATVNVQNKDGRTPLHEASCYGYNDIVPLLLEHGANPDATDKERNTPLQLAAQKEQFAAARLLVEHGANVHARNNGGWTPLHEASCYGYPDIIQLLLGHGANPDATNKERNTPLQLAAQKEQFAAARLLVEHGANVHARNNGGWTPLHEASCYGYPDIIQLLLDHDADVNAINNGRYTPLHLAALNGQLAAARLLVDHGASVHLRTKDGWTPLHGASHHGYPDIILLLLKHGTSLDTTIKLGYTPLHLAARMGHFSAAQLLVEHGANVHLRTDAVWTPLHEASYHGYPDVVLLLLGHGAKLGDTNQDRHTPLHLAAIQGHLAVARLLVKHGANVHLRTGAGWTPLHEASSHGHSDIILLLLEHSANLEVTNNGLYTPFHLAAQKGRLTSARLLVEQGANVNVKNQDGWTPLHEASWYVYLDMIRLLLEHGANTEATNNDRNTPLHLAAHTGQLSVVRLLVEHGASIDAQNINGATPLQEAHHPGVKIFLRLKELIRKDGKHTDSAA